MLPNWWEVQNADDLPTPTVLIYPDRIIENLDQMISWTGDPARLRPHVKTHKLPQIVQMKLNKGIRKFKAATIAEVEMVASAGGEDILLAIQQSGANFIRVMKLIQKFPKARIAMVIDDLNHLEWIRGKATDANLRIPVFIDLNVGMNRSGIATDHKARQLLEQLWIWCDTPNANLEFVGIHAYDGHLHNPDAESLRADVERAFQPVWELVEWIKTRRDYTPTVVVSGTPTSPIIASQNRPHVEVSAGTTVLWDAGQAKTTPTMKFLNAAVLLMRVISRPASNLLCLDLGHKAVASEFPQPRVQLLEIDDAKAVTHSEEHLVVETTKADQLSIGSLVYGIPHHICPTIALHSHVWCVEHGMATECWPVVARNRIISI